MIKANLQKSKNTGVYFSDVVTPEVLRDVCYRITGQTTFTHVYVDNDYQDMFLEKSYNKGRMAIMQYKDAVSYISFSELEIGGRNSSVQSVPTAFNLYYSNPYPEKRLYYYFLNVSGNAETDYQIMIYRLMNTIGFEFLNASGSLQTGDYKLGDFGVARQMSNATRGLSKQGTPLYMAPEVYLGKPYDATADLYSLGLVLHYLLNGRMMPFAPMTGRMLTHEQRDEAFQRRISGEELPLPV